MLPSSSAARCSCCLGLFGSVSAGSVLVKPGCWLHARLLPSVLWGSCLELYRSYHVVTLQSFGVEEDQLKLFPAKRCVDGPSISLESVRAYRFQQVFSTS